jgi:eukaryotic-like serine/threonine-protein kinase
MATATTLLAGRYQLDEPIGTGGYCQVWRAADTFLSRAVAVKLLHAEYARQAEILGRFKAEAQHAGSLSHPNIARVYDYGEPAEGQPPYLVMELIGGPSLASVLAGGPLDAARTMDVIAQAAAGLQAAHASGLIHRDIKPENMLFAPDGTVRITDFGIAHAIGSVPVTVTGMVMGTPGYIAPERVAGGPAGAASDLYALGIVAYECLAGVPPFTGAALEVAAAHRDCPVPPLPWSVPGDVVAFVMSLTAKDPAGRPGTAAEVADRAARLRDGLGARADTTRPLPSAAWPGVPPGVPLTTVADPWPFPGASRAAPPAGRRRRLGAAVAALALAALAGLVLLTMTGFASGQHSPAGPSPAASSAVQPANTPSSASPVSQGPSAPARHGDKKHHHGTGQGGQDGDAQAGD